MRKAALSFLALLSFALPLLAGSHQSNPNIVLDINDGSFRMFMGWKTPVLVSADGELKPLLAPLKREQKEEDRKPLSVIGAARPPADWKDPGFDDSHWPRTRGQVAVNEWYGGNIYTLGNPAEWDLICLRGRFRVTDPDQVTLLKVMLRYYGGAVVYINGEELQRGHLPKGKLDFDALAEKYPDEAYVTPEGKLYGEGDQKHKERYACRVRDIPPKQWLDAVGIPSSKLKKGVNVIAIELHRAPVSELAVLRKPSKVSWRGAPTPWPHCGVVKAQVTFGSLQGLVQCVAPSEPIEVWNAPSAETLYAYDFAHAYEKLSPIRIVGARNGTFSGRIVASSSAPVMGLKAAASELTRKGGGGKIAASRVRVRYAEATPRSISWNSFPRFERLLTEAPEEVPPARFRIRGRKLQPMPCASVPVWVTIDVPADTSPGVYEGTLQVEASGLDKTSVPIHLTVHDWAIPSPQDFTVHHNLYQSHESSALHYGVPLWSDKHFELMGKSLELINQVAGRVCLVPLVVNGPNMGNSEGMVRWIRQTDGSYEYDFTRLDRYLDLYAQKVGKPNLLRLDVWGIPNKKDKNATLKVTVADASGKKLEDMPQPPYGSSENEAFWRPALAELRKRLEKRGWFDVAAFNYSCYCGNPPGDLVVVAKAIWPDGRWQNSSHGNPSFYSAGKDSAGKDRGGMPVPFSEWVWGCGRLYSGGGKKSAYPRPWRNRGKRIQLANVRVGQGIISSLRDGSPLITRRTISEAALQAGLDGIGMHGADFWPVPSARKGKMRHLCNAAYAIGPPNSTMALLAAGPDGAIAGERFEMFREGVQIAEAIIYVLNAIDAGTVQPELAKKCTDLLDERARYYVRTRPGRGSGWLAFESSGWYDRDDRLFALAAEVAKASGAK